MLFSFSLKSSILLIFFFHGIVFSTLLLVKGLQTENKSNLLLSLFILLCAFYIAPFMFGYAGWYSKQHYRDFLFYVPFQQLFLLPPVLYFYIKTLLDKSFQFSTKDYIHFLPATIYLIYSFIIFIVDKVILNEYYFYSDGKDKDFSFWYQVAGLFSLVFYLIRSLRTYNSYRIMTYNSVSFAESVMFKWAKRFLTAFLMLIIIRILFFMINPEWDEFGKKFWYYVSFSVLFYYVSISGYTNSILSATSFKDFTINPNADLKLEADNISETEFINNTKEEKNKVQDLDMWKEKIETLMCNDKMYENPQLVISDISSKLGTHSKKVSQVINQGFNMNFNDFINHYRITYFLQKIQGGEHNIQTFLSIAFECGFNSKSTFNRAFKRATSLNPKEYIEKYYKK
ncbi:helix-turn-helix domain-containing protein [Arcicella lustrica]|uniref:AraC family transcriptional regulator n=1 Tax=Arcicella lustrica TaxID=2984196 RepID=A0ABU5SQX8_9BACT|nr:AraC family transcriptional regulator [Arcicella sp. DC25W]MEA5429716.1 AraC family transcriptional regulator [Arcicella sp. DC25W]